MGKVTEGRDMKRFELLVRMGLLPIERIPILRRAFSNLDRDKLPTPLERDSIFELVDALMMIVLGDPTIFQRVRSDLSSKKFPLKKTGAKKMPYREAIECGLVRYKYESLRDIPNEQLKEFFQYVDSLNSEEKE